MEIQIRQGQENGQADLIMCDIEKNRSKMCHDTASPFYFTSIAAITTPLLKKQLRDKNTVVSLPKHCRPLYSASPFCYIRNITHVERSARNFCVPLYNNGSSRRSFLSRIFPVALCESSDDHEFALPGIQVRRKAATSPQVVGEYEINQQLETESGWDRVKYMYRVESGKFQDEGTQALNTMFYRTVIIGFFLNAIVGSSKQNKETKNLSKSHAILKSDYSRVVMPKQVLMAALKDTAKLSFLAFSLMYVSQTIAAYRNKTTIWEYILSSAIGFGAVGLSHGQGVYKCGVFTLAGAIFGSFGGFAVCRILQDAGLTQEMRSLKKMQQRIKVQRLLVDSQE